MHPSSHFHTNSHMPIHKEKVSGRRRRMGRRAEKRSERVCRFRGSYRMMVHTHRPGGSTTESKVSQHQQQQQQKQATRKRTQMQKGYFSGPLRFGFVCVCAATPHKGQRQTVSVYSLPRPFASLLLLSFAFCFHLPTHTILALILVWDICTHLNVHP